MDIMSKIDKKDIKYQIFVSSTYKDLYEVRLKIIHNILKRDHIPLSMEFFKASSKDIWDVITKTIDMADYYVVIIGNRYGTPKGDISYTESEYDYAYEKGIPILPFIKKNGIKDTDEDELQKEKLDDFIKNKLELRHTPEYWSDENDLLVNIIPSILQIITREPRSGLVKTNKLNDLFKNHIEFSPDLPPLEIIKTAQNSVFISGLGMSFIEQSKNIRPLVDAAKKGIKITLAKVKHDDEDIDRYITYFFGKDEGYLSSKEKSFKGTLKYINNGHNNRVKDIYLDIYHAIAYFAIDYLEKSDVSCIWARHYIINERKGTTEYYYTKATPHEEEAYKWYVKQINLIIDNDGELITRFEKESVLKEESL